MNLGLTDLRYFTEVVARSNVTKAAKVLGITQPSLSNAIRRLERELGTPLFLRSRSGVRLTKAGLVFHGRARELIGAWEALGRAARTRHVEAVAKYTLGCHAAIALHVLPRFLPRLMTDHPGLEIELNHGSSREITEQVVDFRLDFGIVADPSPHPALVIRPLGTDEVCFVASASGSVPRGPRELRAATLLCDPGIYQTQVLLREIAKRGNRFRRQVPTPRLDIVAALVDAGMGVGILPLRVAERIKTKPLVALDWLPRLKNKISLIYRSETRGSPASCQIAREIESQGRWE